MPNAEKDPLREAREASAAVSKVLVETHPELARSLTRDDLVGMGKSLWELGYKKTQEDGEAFELMVDEMRKVAKTSPNPYFATLASNFLFLPMEQISMFWAARWADQAFPVFQMGHKYAAALMATSVTVEEDSIRPPFKAFLIDVPLGLLAIEDSGDGKLYDVKHVLAHWIKNHEGEMVWSYVALTTGRVTIWQHGASTKRLLEGVHIDPEREWSSYSFGMAVGDRDERANHLIQRLMLNTCLAVSSPNSMKAIGKTSKMSPRDVRASQEPLVRTYQVGKPITLDCRDAVRDYLAGQKPGKKLSVQVLVAGHWKNQHHGPKNTLRKIIWIEPYWRGPEDGPILTRPHKLNDDA